MNRIALWKRFLNPLILIALAGPLAAEDCLPCHRQKTPAAVRLWEQSAHAKAKVGCAKCHGSDHARIDKGEVRVDIKACGQCHVNALQQHQASRHGMGLQSGWGCLRNQVNRDPKECRFCHEVGAEQPKSVVQCARFLKQTREMGEVGCNSCHRVETSCASCHTAHATDLKIVRNPNVCAKCHMGPDHPQWEMWQTSQHGTLFESVGSQLAPNCQTCHMPEGSHNVSFGISVSSGGQPYDAALRGQRRGEMARLCASCHATAFVKTQLDLADAVLSQSAALVKEAEEIVGDLADHGLLDPMPHNRPPHPFKKHELELGSQLLFEDTSHIERLLFKMKKFDFAKTIKGAFHNNPAYIHWYGNAELKMDLIDIKSEANRLRERKANRPEATTEDQLRALKHKLERGGLSQEDYRREKDRLLKGSDENPNR
jgi:hypothetical protein